MHCAQIEERATFECFITLSRCPTGLSEITQGYYEVSTHVCHIGWQNFTVRKPTQQNIDGMCIRYILPGCLSVKSIANTFYALKISRKHPEWLFSYNQVWRHRLRHIIVRNLSINTVLTSSSNKLWLQKDCFIFSPLIKIRGQLCKMSIFVKFAFIFSRFKKCPCKIYSHLLCLRFSSNTEFVYVYELMMTE